MDNGPYGTKDIAVTWQHCGHPPDRYFTWYANDGVLCVGCCDCGRILHGAAPDSIEEWENEQDK